MATGEYVTLMGREFYSGYLNAHPGIKAALESGEVEGVPFRLVDGEIEAGDTYIAERNVGLKLLTCRENVKDQRFICPVENAYAYDTGECIKIELVLD